MVSCSDDVGLASDRGLLRRVNQVQVLSECGLLSNGKDTPTLPLYFQVFIDSHGW